MPDVTHTTPTPPVCPGCGGRDLEYCPSRVARETYGPLAEWLCNSCHAFCSAIAARQERQQRLREEDRP